MKALLGGMAVQEVLVVGVGFEVVAVVVGCASLVDEVVVALVGGDGSSVEDVLDSVDEDWYDKVMVEVTVDVEVMVVTVDVEV